MRTTIAKVEIYECQKRRKVRFTLENGKAYHFWRETDVDKVGRIYSTTSNRTFEIMPAHGWPREHVLAVMATLTYRQDLRDHPCTLTE